MSKPDFSENSLLRKPYINIDCEDVWDYSTYESNVTEGNYIFKCKTTFS